MTSDIEEARRDKKELLNFLTINNIPHRYIGINIDIAEYVILVGLDKSTDWSIIPDHVNSTRIKKEVAKVYVAL